MSLLQGGLSLRRFLALGPVPEERELLAALAGEPFRPFQDGMEEERHGWADWRNPLITPPEPDWVMQDRFALFALRIDTRRVPPLLLRAHVELRLAALLKEKDLAFVGKEARIALQDEVKADLLRKVLPTPRVVEVAWDLRGGVLWTTAASGKAQSALAQIFHKSFGIEIQPMAPLVLAGRLCPELPPELLMALEPLRLDLEAP
ncbi:MAG: recombination-associated protein RdgC [Acidobacteria bacterium]|nr:recombination-associated protein RdgC [Acidobacteriota bacterium]